MNADYRLKTTKLLAVVGVLAISLTGCGAQKAYNRGVHAAVLKDFDTAMTEFKIALDKDPDDIDYRLKYEQARYNAAFAHFDAGRRALDKEDYETAKAEFTRVGKIEPPQTGAQQQPRREHAALTASSAAQAE